MQNNNSDLGPSLGALHESLKELDVVVEQYYKNYFHRPAPNVIKKPISIKDFLDYLHNKRKADIIFQEGEKVISI